MLRAYSGFLLSAFLTLGSGILLAREDGLSLDGLAWVGLYAGAICSQWLISGSLGFSDEGVPGPGVSAEGDGFFYCGAVFEDTSEPGGGELREALSGDRMRLRVLSLVVLAAAYGFLRSHLLPAGPSLAAYLALPGVAAIVFASSPGHFVIALGLNALAVTLSLALSDHPPASVIWLGAGFYLFLLILTLQLYRMLKIEARDPRFNLLRSEEARTALAKSSGALAFYFVALLVCVDWVIPERVVLRRDDSGAQECLFALNRGAGYALSKFRPLGQAKMPRTLAIPQALGVSSFGGQLPQLSPQAVRLLASVLESTRKTSGADRDLGHGGSPLDPEAIQTAIREVAQGSGKPEASLRLTAQDLEHAVREAQEELSRHPYPTPLAGVDPAVELGRLDQALRQLPVRGTVTSGSETGTEATTQRVSSSPVKTNASAPEKAALPSNDSPPLFGEATLLRMLRVAKFVGISICALVLYYFLARVFGPRALPEALDAAQTVELESEQRRRLREEWRSLSRRKLSARDEVIEKYHFFLDVMKALGHPRPESLPPSEYAGDLRRVFPWISGHVLGVTDAFCDVLYGERDLGVAELGEFRVRMERIRSNFF